MRFPEIGTHDVAPGPEPFAAIRLLPFIPAIRLVPFISWSPALSSKSNLSKARRLGKTREPVKRSCQPDGFPLWLHPSGRWCKKVRARFHYIGPVADDPEGKAVLRRWLEVNDDLLAGRSAAEGTGSPMANRPTSACSSGSPRPCASTPSESSPGTTTPSPPAPLEGTNNKIETMKQQAYGFRDPEFLKLVTLQPSEVGECLGGRFAVVVRTSPAAQLPDKRQPGAGPVCRPAACTTIRAGVCVGFVDKAARGTSPASHRHARRGASLAEGHLSP